MMVPAPGDGIVDPENSADGRDASAPDSEHGGQPDEISTDTQSKVLHIVGIGASAGGLEALEALLGNLPPDASPAFVVAQHLSPDRRSLLVELMSRCTPLQVRQAVDGAVLLPGTVSIGPPNHDIRVDRERLVVSDPEPRFGPSPSIDRLFDSIAEHWGERGVAVVLSGTGSDGARGLVAVRAAGGLTIAQTPDSARFAGMPTAAITLGGAELVLEPASIGRRLGELLPPSGHDPADGGLGENADPVNVFSFLARLRHLTGIDFSQYKAATVRRQLQRRMTICQKPSIEEYLKLLETDSRESLALVKNLLVSVTAFFRDPAMFAALAERLGHYINEWPGRYRLRVWVPGCATGEEAYSLGMLISEVLGHPMNLADHLKIFATDLDEESLAVARRGTYPAVDAEAIPEGLRNRFVSFHDGELTIKESLRRCLVFARHNIAEDPPFPRLDLISCRNTLIYFNPPLQRRTLVMFHTGLVPGGLLFLGPSESPRVNAAGFTSLDGAHNIYQRTSEPQPVAIASRALSALSAPSVPGQAARPAVLPDTLPEEHTATLEALVRSSCPPCVVVDDNHELVEVIGEVAPFCRLPEGRISTGATAFLLPELQMEARALVLLVRAEGQPVRSRPLLLKESGLLLRLEARPLRVRDRQFTVLSFLPERDAPEENAGSDDVRERDNNFEREISRMESDLLSSQESQRSSMAQLEAANQELEASAEELQAFSEELQSANEELQASNLELVSLNHQLRIRSEQLQAFTSDLENIQNSLTQGMVIVDQGANVNRYTPLAVRVFGLVEADIGRPLLGCPTTIPLPGLKEALREVLSGSPRRVLEALNEEAAYLVQVLPYREQDGQQRGAIISLTDVSELREMRQAAEASLGEFASLTDTLEQAVWKRDISLHRLLYASLRVLPLTGWSPAELCAQPQLLDEAIDPDDRERVWSARDQQRPGWTVSFRLITRDGRRRWLTETAKVIDDGRERSVVGTLADVTDQRESAEETRRLSLQFETLISSPGLALAVLDPDRRVVLVNETLCGLLGFERDSLLGSPASLFCVLPPLPKPVPEEEMPVPGPPLKTTLPLLHRDGSTLPLPAQIWQLPPAGGSRILMLILPPPTPQP